MFLDQLTAFFTAIVTMISLLLFPATPATPIFSDSDAAPEKAVFDEGDFSPAANDLFVSPAGDDTNPGTQALPLKSLSGAKEKLRQYKAAALTEKVTVWFSEGTYFFDECIKIDSNDYSGVVFRSIPGENVVFSGTQDITEWSNSSINGHAALVADVDTDNLYFRSVFKNGERLSNSIWPKTGVFTVKEAKDSDALLPDNVEFFKLHAAFYAHKNEVMDFDNVKDVNVRIMHKWCDDILPLLSADTNNGRIELRKAAAITIENGDNYIYENVREALSLPGEWYLDRSENKLYYIPCENETAQNLVLSVPVTDQLIDINGVSDITFLGISFKETDWDFVSGKGNIWKPADPNHPLYANLDYVSTHPQASYEVPAAITAKNAKDINFVNCSFRNIMYSAIMFAENVTNCEVSVCRFDEIGGNAVFINAPLVIPTVTNNISITDCEISNYGRIYNHSIGVLLCHASDCVISNNEIHDGWYTAISSGWVWGYAPNPTNNIQITDNLIYNIGNGWLSDMGGIYTLGIQPDSVISGNVIYNVGCYDGETGYGGWGIYLDEGSSEFTVENNLVYDCSSQCFHQHYGRDNVIRNNIFAFGGDGDFIVTKNEDHNSLTLTNNILVTDKNLMYRMDLAKDWFVDNNNLYWDYGSRRIYSGTSMNPGDRIGIACGVADGYYNNAVFENPLFKNPDARDFTLADNSPAIEKIGFVPFAYDAGTRYVFE